MNDLAERTDTMTAYAQTYGGPDGATTTRMRQRLRERELHLQTTTSRRRLRLAAALVAIAAVAGGIWWWSARPSEMATASADELGTVATTDRAQRLELVAGGSLTLEPATRMRLAGDVAGRTDAELLEGGVRFAPASGAHAVNLRIGPYRVESTGAAFEARRTRGVPLVVVTEGRVRLLGPDLPPEGLRIAPER